MLGWISNLALGGGAIEQAAEAGSQIAGGWVRKVAKHKEIPALVTEQLTEIRELVDEPSYPEVSLDELIARTVLPKHKQVRVKAIAKETGASEDELIMLAILLNQGQLK